MPIDREFVDKWSGKYDDANRATAFRLDGTRLEKELRKERQDAYLRERFAVMYDRLRQLRSERPAGWWALGVSGAAA